VIEIRIFNIYLTFTSNFMYNSDGDRYEGEWSNDERVSQCILYPTPCVLCDVMRWAVLCCAFQPSLLHDGTFTVDDLCARNGHKI
jgi:hypothetical protein